MTTATPAGGDEWNSGPTTNGTMSYASGDARFNGGDANELSGDNFGGGDATGSGTCNNCGQGKIAKSDIILY